MGSCTKSWMDATLNPKRCDIQTAAWTSYNITYFFIFDQQKFVQNEDGILHKILGRRIKSWGDEITPVQF